MARRKAQGDPKRAVAYVRTSTEFQDNGAEGQRHELRAWSKRTGVEIVAWHEDKLSGATPVEKREGFLSALADLRQYGAGVLIATKRDRLARDVVVAAAIERLVEDAGASVLTADGVSAEATPEGALLRVLLDSFSQYERARIRARITAAMAVKRRRGEFLGEAPIGYARAGTMLAPDAIEQAALGRIRELRAEGLSVRRIAEKLNAEGIPARGARWNHTTVHRCVRREEVAR